MERSDDVLEVSNNLLEGKGVQPVAREMRSIVVEAAWPPVPGESVGAAIGRAARRLQLGYSRVRAYWYNRPPHFARGWAVTAHEARLADNP